MSDQTQQKVQSPDSEKKITSRYEKLAERIIFESSSKEEAIKMRDQIQMNCDFIWIFVCKDNDHYTVSIANHFCGALSDDEFNKVKSFVDSLKN